MIELSMENLGRGKKVLTVQGNKPFVELLNAWCAIWTSNGIAVLPKRISPIQLEITFYRPKAELSVLSWISRMLEVGNREFFQTELVRIKRCSRTFNRRGT